MAACPEPTRNHQAGSELIAQIENVQTIPGFTAYDVLCLPMYKTQAEHVTNHANLVVELSFPACNCLGKAGALIDVNNAWGLISTPLLRIAYDTLIDTPPPLGVYVQHSRNYPSAALTDWFRPANFPAVIPNPGYPLDHPFSRFFKGVEYCPETYFEKIRRNEPSELFHRNQEYSFWFALSTSMDLTDVLWCNRRNQVEIYMFSVMNNPTEPRYKHYWALMYSSRTRGGYPPHGDIYRQVEPDGNVMSISIPGAPYQVEIVSPELWQIVADALSIELIIIMAHIPATRVGRRPNKTVITRGDHRNRQFYLLLEEDGEYRCVTPFVSRPETWRFTGHILRDLPRGSRNVRNTARRTAALEESNVRRCPLIEIDVWGIPTHLDQPAGGPPMLPVLIPSRYPGVARGIYIPPIRPLEVLSHDANPTIWPSGRRVGALCHINPPSRRWI